MRSHRRNCPSNKHKRLPKELPDSEEEEDDDENEEKGEEEEEEKDAPWAFDSG